MATEVRPALRGLVHRAGAFLAVPAAVVLVALAPGGRARLAAAVGIVLEWLPSATPRGVAHTLYLVRGAVLLHDAVVGVTLLPGAG